MNELIEIKMSELTTQHIQEYEIILFQRNKAANLIGLSESWKELLKLLIAMLYEKEGERCIRLISEANIMDRNTDVTSQQYCKVTDDERFVSVEPIDGTPYNLFYEPNNKKLPIKLKKLSALLRVKDKVAVLTLKIKDSSNV